MKRFRSIVGAVTLLVSAFVLLQKIQAQTPTPVSSCGTVSGNVILTQDISTTNADCLTVGSPNTTIDGNGKIITINSSGHGIFNYQKFGLTVRNLTSNSDIYINGDTADNVLIEDSNLGGVYIAGADDVIIRNNTLGVATLGEEGSDAERITFTGNQVRSNSNKLLAIRGSGVVPCTPSNHVITNNTLTADHVCTEGVDCDEPMAVFIWCSAGSTYSDNTIIATGKSQGIRLRDESDNNTFTRNTVWVDNPDGAFGSLNLTSGNPGKHHPRLNTFTNNLFRSNTDLSLSMQAPGDGNVFTRNIFWSNTSGTANLMNAGSNGNSWDHNTFYNAGSAPALFFDYRTTRTPDTFMNNIIVSSGPSAVQVTAGVGWSFDRYTGDNNLFYSTQSTSAFQPIGSLTAWRSAAIPDDSVSLFGNPLLTNVNAGDFSLQSSSPARGTGSNGSDIGAIPYGSGSSCSENWICSDWSACINGVQVRNCTDTNACSTTTTRPALSQSCTSGTGPDITAPSAIGNLFAT